MKIKLKDRKTQQVLLTKWEKKVVKLNLSPSQTTDSLSTYITIFIHWKKSEKWWWLWTPISPFEGTMFHDSSCTSYII